MWYLFLHFIILILAISISAPFLITITLTCNVVKLKGMVKIKILFWTQEIRFRIKNGYLYLYQNGREIKEKISRKNVNLKFLIKFTGETYLRQELLKLEFSSNFGYNLDSLVTASTASLIDVIAKSVLAKIKHNKKSSNIFTVVNPKYNEDVFNIRVKTAVSNSLFDIIVAFIMSKCYLRGDKNVQSK